ncbi:Alanine--tRNA ligase [Quillaja saponaria]|uniref:Alanine--tRNA ligase n=1 Tax=Quillaja saponaria TaxID=32244 RepID=A0AAD7LZV7_QUISA|nr:Alanine--tRNA ligase [Quillaja saponaria]
MLWISVYEDDKEAFEIWRDELGVPLERIKKMGEDEKLWSSGITEGSHQSPCCISNEGKISSSTEQQVCNRQNIYNPKSNVDNNKEKASELANLSCALAEDHKKKNLKLIGYISYQMGLSHQILGGDM